MYETSCCHDARCKRRSITNDVKGTTVTQVPNTSVSIGIVSLSQKEIKVTLLLVKIYGLTTVSRDW